MRKVIRPLAVSLVLLAGCGAEAVAPVAVMILTNTWRVEGSADPTHVMQFLDDTNGVAQAEGTFTGTERLNDGATEYPLTGYWRNSRVYLTVQRTPVRTYTARIEEDNTDRLEFSGSAGSFVVTRN